MNTTYRTFVVTDLYEEHDSKFLIKFEMHGEVDPFILSQHIFKIVGDRIDIKFIDLYDAVKFTHEIDDRQKTINSKYGKVLVSAFGDCEEYQTDQPPNYQTIEVWEDSIYPFTMYYVNGEKFCNDRDIFSVKNTNYELTQYIINDLGGFISFDKQTKIREELNELLAKHDHFKYKEFEVTRRHITRLSEVKDLGM